MSSIVIGVDPDSKAHGVAIYKDGKIQDLLMLELMELMETIKSKIEEVGKNSRVTIHIENVEGEKAVWHGGNQSKAAYGVTSQRVAKCKQAQLEVERMCKYIGVSVVRHPISKMWKKQTGKKQFEMITGWTGRSNEDTRSAAYFGYLGCK